MIINTHAGQVVGGGDTQQKLVTRQKSMKHTIQTLEVCGGAAVLNLK